MSSKSFQIEPEFYQYVTDNWLREATILSELREETAQLEHGRMQISPEQGSFMAMLVKLLDVRRYLEVGVFTGYSSLAVALAMPKDGRVVACDVSEEYTSVARRYWEKAGVGDQIQLILAPATDTLGGMIETGQEPFDMMFIDADKSNYDHYYELGLNLLRPGGIILIDNVFWSGAVADLTKDDPDTMALRAINAKLHEDDRIDLAIVPIGDGLTMARRK